MYDSYLYQPLSTLMQKRWVTQKGGGPSAPSPTQNDITEKRLLKFKTESIEHSRTYPLWQLALQAKEGDLQMILLTAGRPPRCTCVTIVFLPLNQIPKLYFAVVTIR